MSELVIGREVYRKVGGWVTGREVCRQAGG